MTELKKIFDSLPNNFFSIKEWLIFFYKIRFIHFLLIGGIGVLINILLTTFFTEFFFGRELYFYAYLIGLFSNLIYNFTFHTIITFKTKDKHKKRFIFYIIYNLFMSVFQAFLIKNIVDSFGVDYYLLVIIGVIGFFFLINFIISKFLIFKKN